MVVVVVLVLIQLLARQLVEHMDGGPRPIFGAGESSNATERDVHLARNNDDNNKHGTNRQNPAKP